jgi:FKBP-type peptidyl-prolyl cis-trans isomerase
VRSRVVVSYLPRYLMFVPEGWDEGVAGMKVGGERLLIIPAPLGYGGRKMDNIPANSTLRFGKLNRASIPSPCGTHFVMQKSSSST